MDRRRFVPSADGLEGRALMSLFGGATPKSNHNVSIEDLPNNFQKKALRIEHLPYYLDQTQPGRFLPSGAIKQLQADLTEIAGNLHAPSTKVVNTFNTSLRHAFPYQTISAANARFLNSSFGNVLNKAGATPAQETSLRADMNAIAKADSQGNDPTFLVANDYALVLQTTLAIGRPIPTPTRPTLDTTSGTKSKSGAAGWTHQSNPILTGSYSAGATASGFTTMQILNENNQVIGTGVVDKAGQYAVHVSIPLPKGISHLRARAVDILGNESLPSPGSFMLKYVPKPGSKTIAESTTFAPTSTDPLKVL